MSTTCTRYPSMTAIADAGSPPGAFCWLPNIVDRREGSPTYGEIIAVPEDVKSMYLVLPVGADGLVGPVHIAPNVSGEGWTWDGDLDAPTLSPSIDQPGVWHGWMRAGVLTAV